MYAISPVPRKEHKGSSLSVQVILHGVASKGVLDDLLARTMSCLRSRLGENSHVTAA